jgi:hypothetical protein
MRSLGHTVQATLVAFLASAALGGCGDTLVDHRNTAVQKSPEQCRDNEALCGPVDAPCVPQGTQTGQVCGALCLPCTSAPANASPVCLPTEPHNYMCDHQCDSGYLKTTSGCSLPLLVAAGGQFSCATAAATGEVHCWGANDQGQLGPGVGGLSRATSGKVQDAALVGVTALAAGPAHACAAVGGTVYCWGDATGFGGLVSGATPTAVTELANVVTLVAGAKHTCGVTGTGALKCTGAGTDGGGSPTLGGAVLDIAAGDSFSCALVDDGSPSRAVKCWGADDHGQSTGAGVPGNATASPTTIPFPPGSPGGLVLTHVAAGATHACATTDQPKPVTVSVFCWGDDTSHQLGVNGGGGTAEAPTASKINKPVSTAGPTVIAAGGVATCALEEDGGSAIQCWGGDPLAAGGGTGIGELIDLLPLTAVPPGAFALGGGHGCIVTPDGKLNCWGHGTEGQLGNGGTVDSSTRVLVVDR